MTNPSIPPCPVCGTVPTESSANFEYAFGVGDLFVGCCGREKNGVKAIYQRHNWQAVGDNTLGRALRTHGVHTLAELDKRLAPDPRVAPIFWTPIPPTSEMVPGKDVLLMCQNDSGKTYVVIGCWIPQYWDEVCDEDNSEYCEEKDEYFCPAGWYEQIQNWDDYGSVAISDKVTHYMPIPKLIAAQRGEG